MKRLISLLILLLAGPSLASAQFTATSGGTSIDVIGTSSSFGAAGPDFSMSGLISYGRNPLDTGSGWGVGSPLELVLYGDTLTPNLDISVNVHGAPLTVFTAFATFSSEPISVPGPGTHMEPFIFSSAVSSLEGDFDFFGRGIVTLDVVPTDTPDVVNILSANYTFTNPSHVPEPPTTSLLLLGVAGLALLNRRKPSAKLFPRDSRARSNRRRSSRIAAVCGWAACVTEGKFPDTAEVDFADVSKRDHAASDT